jgi:hypothetical protein
MASDQLEIYLNDHLAGAVAAIDLLERLRTDHAEGTLANDLITLQREIEADRDTLQAIIDRVHRGHHRIKHAAAKLAEKTTQFKLSPMATGSVELTQLLELEALYLGVHGKRALWKVLREVARTRAELADFDFNHLILRAERQLDGLDHHRLAVAVPAFDAEGDRG